MERFIYSYIFCGLLFGLIVAFTEIRQKTYRGQYIFGTLLLPSVVFGNWRYTYQANSPNAHSKVYLRLKWMSRVHLLLLIAAILVPYNFIGLFMYELVEPGIQNTDSWGSMGIEAAFDGALMFVGGLMLIIELLVWTVVYMVLGFFLVILPRILRPHN